MSKNKKPSATQKNVKVTKKQQPAQKPAQKASQKPVAKSAKSTAVKVSVKPADKSLKPHGKPGSQGSKTANKDIKATKPAGLASEKDSQKSGLKKSPMAAKKSSPEEFNEIEMDDIEVSDEVIEVEELEELEEEAFSASDDSDDDGEEIVATSVNANAEGDDEEVILTDAEGNRYCRVRDCDQIASVDLYCRFHYLLLWNKIQIRKKILTDGKLEHYVVELTSRYPDKFLEMIRKDLRTQKDFLSAIQELEIDESGLENEFEEQEDAQSFIEEVRGGMGSGDVDVAEDDF